MLERWLSGGRDSVVKRHQQLGFLIELAGEPDLREAVDGTEQPLRGVKQYVVEHGGAATRQKQAAGLTAKHKGLTHDLPAAD